MSIYPPQLMLPAVASGVPTLDIIHNVDALQLLKALPDESIDALITDMPYGQTRCAWDSPVDLVQWWIQVRRVLKPHGVFVTTSSQPFTSKLVMSNPKWFRYDLIWHKTQSTGHLNAMIMPLREHEEILVFGVGSINYYPQISKKRTKDIRSYSYRGQSPVYGKYHADTLRLIDFDMSFPRSVLRFSNPNHGEKGMHPTQKPVALYEYLIQTYTRPGELVLDPFSGSGTTALAARKTGRRFICGDSSLEYVEMSRKRLAQTDPYLDRQITPDLKQRSLFAQVTL